MKLKIEKKHIHPTGHRLEGKLVGLPTEDRYDDYNIALFLQDNDGKPIASVIEALLNRIEQLEK